MPEAQRPDKAQTRLRISQAVFKLELQKGHLRWKVTDLVRLAKISRPLVYRYFGNTKEKIFDSAFVEFTDHFFGYDNSDLDFLSYVKLSQSYALKNPEVVIFYLYWRNKVPKWQKEFKRIEDRLRQSIRDQHPGFSDAQVTWLHTFLHGLVTAPFLRESEIDPMLAMAIPR